MARGFESKDVEFQQAEAERSRGPARTISSEERARAAARHSVELALVRARAERLSTVSPIRREMLARAIAELERQLTLSLEPSR